MAVAVLSIVYSCSYSSRSSREVSPYRKEEVGQLPCAAAAAAVKRWEKTTQVRKRPNRVDHMVARLAPFQSEPPPISPPPQKPLLPPWSYGKPSPFQPKRFDKAERERRNYTRGPCYSAPPTSSCGGLRAQTPPSRSQRQYRVDCRRLHRCRPTRPAPFQFFSLRRPKKKRTKIS